MKGKTKTQKGITLVALIITIVVLLILASVAISSIQNDGIIGKSNNAAGKYNQAQQNEQGILGGYEEFLNNYGGSGVSTPVDPKVGQYVEYDVSYTDMYQGTTYTKTNGWRYLGTESGTGNHLLISTGVPMILDYGGLNAAGEYKKWWDQNETLDMNVRATNGMLKNFAKIPYTQTASGISVSTADTAIGRFAGTEITENGITYTAVGDYFKVTGKTYSNSIKVRTLTLAELNRAVNSAREGEEGYTARAETSTASGFKDLTGDALGLFDMQDLTDYTANYYYWLASPKSSGTEYELYFVIYTQSMVHDVDTDVRNGIRPVVVLSSGIQFTDADNNTVLEINMNQS